MCIFSFHGCKIEHIVGVQNEEFFFFFFFFQNAYLMVMSAGKTGHNQCQNCENVCFSMSKLNDIHVKLNKIEFCFLSYLSFRETSHHNHKCPLRYL